MADQNKKPAFDPDKPFDVVKSKAEEEKNKPEFDDKQEFTKGQRVSREEFDQMPGAERFLYQLMHGAPGRTEAQDTSPMMVSPWTAAGLPMAPASTAGSIASAFPMGTEAVASTGGLVAPAARATGVLVENATPAAAGGGSAIGAIVRRLMKMGLHKAGDVAMTGLGIEAIRRKLGGGHH